MGRGLVWLERLRTLSLPRSGSLLLALFWLARLLKVAEPPQNRPKTLNKHSSFGRITARMISPFRLSKASGEGRHFF